MMEQDFLINLKEMVTYEMPLDEEVVNRGSRVFWNSLSTCALGSYLCCFALVTQ